jgi:hypothetical protein
MRSPDGIRNRATALREPIQSASARVGSASDKVLHLVSAQLSPRGSIDICRPMSVVSAGLRPPCGLQAITGILRSRSLFRSGPVPLQVGRWKHRAAEALWRCVYFYYCYFPLAVQFDRYRVVGQFGNTVHQAVRESSRDLTG